MGVRSTTTRPLEWIFLLLGEEGKFTSVVGEGDPNGFHRSSWGFRDFYGTFFLVQRPTSDHPPVEEGDTRRGLVVVWRGIDPPRLNGTVTQGLPVFTLFRSRVLLSTGGVSRGLHREDLLPSLHSLGSFGGRKCGSSDDSVSPSRHPSRRVGWSFRVDAKGRPEKVEDTLGEGIVLESPTCTHTNTFNLEFNPLPSLNRTEVSLIVR